MRRVLPLVVLALLASLAPAASAQPDPAAVVEQVCALAGDARDALPVCPQEDPAAPAEPAAPEQAAAPAEPAAPTDPEGAAGAAQGLADEARETAEEAAADPASAPDRIVAFLATIIQFLKDLLALPGIGARAALDGAAFVGGAIADAAVATGQAIAAGASATGDAISGAFAKVGEVAGGAWDAVVSLFAPAPAETVRDGVAAPDVPEVGAADAAGLLERAVGALPKA